MQIPNLFSRGWMSTKESFPILRTHNLVCLYLTPNNLCFAKVAEIFLYIEEKNQAKCRKGWGRGWMWKGYENLHFKEFRVVTSQHSVLTVSFPWTKAPRSVDPRKGYTISSARLCTLVESQFAQCLKIGINDALCLLLWVNIFDGMMFAEAVGQCRWCMAWPEWRT